MNNNNEVLYQILEEIRGIKKGQESDRELLEITVDQVGKLTSDVKSLNDDVKSLKDGQTRLENVVTRIEHDHGQKLDALFDGYKQTYEMLTNVQKELSKDEKIIFQRIK